MARLLLALLLLLPVATPVRAADSTMDLLRFLEMLSPKAEPAPAPDSAIETQLRYLEKDLDQLREEVKALPEARRLERLEAEIVGLRAEIKAAEKSAEEAVKEKLDKRLDAQDKRIGDLGHTLSTNSLTATWVSAFITLVLFSVTIWTAISVPRQAQDAARLKAEELNRDAISQARAQAADAAEKAAALWITEKAERKLHEIEALAQEQRDDHTKKIEATIAQMNARPDPTLSGNKNTPEQEKPQDQTRLANEQDAIFYIQSLSPSHRTGDQWLALTRHLIDQKSYEAAVSVCDDWLRQPSLTIFNTATALNRRGYCLAEFTPPQWQAAIVNWEAVISRFGSDPTPTLREHVAWALSKKGFALCKLDPPKWDNAIAVFTEVVTRFGPDSTPALREYVARALVNKSTALQKLDPPKWDDTIAVCTEVVTRFGSDSASSLREEVATALVNKGNALGELAQPKFSDAIAAYTEVVTCFGNDPNLALREQVAWALANKGVVLQKLDPPKWRDAIAAFTEVVTRFGNDPASSLREKVARALHFKAITLRHHEYPAEARAVCADYLRRFADASELYIQETADKVRALLANLPPPEPPADP